MKGTEIWIGNSNCFPDISKCRHARTSDEKRAPERRPYGDADARTLSVGAALCHPQYGKNIQNVFSFDLAKRAPERRPYGDADTRILSVGAVLCRPQYGKNIQNVFSFDLAGLFSMYSHILL